MNRLTKEFKRFWGAQSLSMLGNQASSFVWTTLLVTSYSISSEQISGINALIQGITVVLPVLVAPYLKKRNLFSEIAFLDILRGICYTLIGILCFLEMLPVYLFVVIVIVAETLGKIFSPLFYVSPIYLVEDIDRTVANSRIATSESVTEIIGAPFGSILYTYVGPFAAFVLNAISFFVGGHTSLQLKTHWNMPDTKNSMHYWRDICNGFRQVIQEPSLRKITMNTLIYNLAAGAMISVFPILVLRDMALSGSTYALIISIGACGGVVASLVAPVITQKIGFRFTLMVGILIQIPELIILSFASQLADYINFAVCSLYVIAESFGVTLYVISNGTMRQFLVDAEKLLQFQATYKFITHMGAPLGAALAGVVTALWSTDVVPFVCAWVLVTLVLMIVFWIKNGEVKYD